MFIFPVSVFACDGWPSRIDTKYTTICYSSENSLKKFTKNIGKKSSFFSAGLNDNPHETAGRVDSLVDRVSRLLDMHTYGIRFNIYIFQNQNEIERAYARISNLGIFGRIPIAFYSHKKRTVYLSVENINAGILAHEVAHTVINFYFAEPPPEKMQEILAQYVDKHLWEE